MRLQMSLSENKTSELWRSFMPQRNTIQNSIGPELYSLQRYPPFYFEAFRPENTFEKWAAVEVAHFGAVPGGMEILIVPPGLYAVFHYRGLSADMAIFQYIFTVWLPHSGYEMDNRPHFEILGEKFKNGDPNSEEEIWIPVKLKQGTT
jgi:AraC family transcriptional regulator